MGFDIKGKVALITGGGAGIGLEYGKELLRQGLKGLTIADINEEIGNQAVTDLTKQFGPNKVIFVKTDVTIKKELEDAFKKCVDKFKNIDIVINNAGIMNDAIWEKEILLNLNGTIYGILLGLDHYIPKYKSDSEGVILNVSSIAGVQGYGFLPIYCGTKFAVMGLTKSWGCQEPFDRTKVRVLAVCPGATNTAMISGLNGRNLGDAYQNILHSTMEEVDKQSPEQCARGVIDVIKHGGNGSIWIVEGGEKPYEFILPLRHTMKKQ